MVFSKVHEVAVLFAFAGQCFRQFSLAGIFQNKLCASGLPCDQDVVPSISRSKIRPPPPPDRGPAPAPDPCGKPENRLLRSAMFGLFTTLTNDVGVGLPIVEALFPKYVVCCGAPETKLVGGTGGPTTVECNIF